jgi:hypothetical protein
MKKCPRCKQTKNLSEFGYRNKERTKVASTCKVCMRLYRKEHYHNNKQQYRDRNKKSNARNRKLYIEYLQGAACKDCGEDDPIVLEFDHVRGTKKMAVSKMIRNGYGANTIEKEIAKCDVRCANCHRRKTAKEGGWIDYYKE